MDKNAIIVIFNIVLAIISLTMIIGMIYTFIKVVRDQLKMDKENDDWKRKLKIGDPVEIQSGRKGIIKAIDRVNNKYIIDSIEFRAESLYKPELRSKYK